MRIHIVGVPRNPSTKDIAMDPYAMVSYYLTTYLHRAGHEVNYYGFLESTVECDKKWVIADSEHHHKYNVTDFEKKHWEINDEGFRIYGEAALDKLKSNVLDNEIVICMWSSFVSKFNNELNQIKQGIKVVDGHIGHRHPDLGTPYHVYASYSNRHLVYGMNPDYNNYWFDTVIYPMANDLDNFTFKEKKKDYFLFMGRLNEDKGIGVFLDIAKHFPDKKFILAGQGTHNREVPKNVKEVGLLNVSQRKKYLSEAKAVISPSHYSEPFGLTSVEAGLSGTPIICTDHGGYTESVVEGVTGFRCSYFVDFVNAINNVEELDPKECRKNAERFSAEVLIKDWERYLHKINRDTWYSLDNE